MTAEQKLILKTLAEESDLAVAYAERGEADPSLVHMRRVRDALADLVREVTRNPFDDLSGDGWKRA